MTEHELRAAVSSSRKEGYRLLFAEYYPYVYHIVWNTIRAVGSPEDAEECVSDVFAELFGQFDAIEEGGLHGFIRMLARRRAINLFHRLTGQKPTVSLDEETAGELASDERLEDALIEAQGQDKLLAHIRSLGSPDTEMILLKYFYGCNATQIAEKLRMNPITVRVRLSRALKKLRKLLTADPFFME